MKEYTVTYYLSDEQEKQLEKVTSMFNKLSPVTQERYFALLMLFGSDRIIDSNLALAEKQLEANYGR